MKARVEHRVPLGKAAVTVLSRMHAERVDDVVFSGQKPGANPLEYGTPDDVAPNGSQRLDGSRFPPIGINLAITKSSLPKLLSRFVLGNRRERRAREILTLAAYRTNYCTITTQLRSISSSRTRRAVDAPAPRQMPLDFPAIGDSWFEYPLTDDGLPTGFNRGMVGDAGTQPQSMGSPVPTILSYALHGQSTTQMLSYENQKKDIERID
jgi:hypothetical protein